MISIRDLSKVVKNRFSLPLLLLLTVAAPLQAGLPVAVIGEMHQQHLQRGRVDYLEVVEVEKDSSAEAAGFEVGDIIFSVNKQLARSFDEVFALIENNGKALIMNIQRGDRELFILLK